MREQIAAVRRMQRYISAHLDEEITLAQLAEAAAFSPWYAHRLFRQWTKVSPAQYIRRLKLSASALRLRDGQTNVTDAAFSLGFSSVESYSRAFFREFGCNPGEYARDPGPLYLFTPYDVTDEQEGEVTDMSQVKNVFVQRVEKPARLAVVKRARSANEYWSYCEEVGCEVWGLLKSMTSLCGEPVCMWLPQAMRKAGTSEYVQGVEKAIGDDSQLPEGFDVIELPAASYLQFCGEPFAEEDFEQAIEQLWQAEKKFDPTSLGLEWDDSNPRIQLEPVGTRGYIELLPVRSPANGK